MPIVHDPEEVEKEGPRSLNECKTWPPHSRGGTSYSDVYGAWRSDFAVGTIWECPDCATYAVTVSRGAVSTFWSPIRWYHLSAKRKIRELEAEKLPAEGKVL